MLREVSREVHVRPWDHLWSHTNKSQTHTPRTQEHTHNHSMSLYSHLSLSHQKTLIAHIPSSSVLLVDSLNLFLQCWSRHWEDCSVIQEQYLRCVWRRQANGGLWLNAWHGINAPCHEGRSSHQDHAHQESHVLRFKVMQCSSICIALHHISYECIHSPNILLLLNVNVFCQPTTPLPHSAIVMF